MSAKKATKQTEAPKPLKRKNVQVEVKPTGKPEVQAHKMAKKLLSPAVATFRVMHAAEAKSGVLDKTDVHSLVIELEEQVNAVTRAGGDCHPAIPNSFFGSRDHRTNGVGK